MSHKRLASALGLTADWKLRQMVERNIVEFQRYGEVSTAVVETSSKGGRPGKLLLLNEGQAILASVRSDAPKAPEVRYQVITAFMAWRRAQSEPQPTIPVKAYKRRTSTHLDAAYRLARTADRLEAIAAKLAPIHASVAFIDGVQVPYDQSDYQIHNAEAVVIRQDGTWAVEVVEWRGGDRTGYGPSRYGAYGRPDRPQVTILGRVLRPVVAPTLALPMVSPRGPRPVYRDAILAALAQGCTARQAAQLTGASIHTVRDWQRRRQHVAAIAA